VRFRPSLLLALAGLAVVAGAAVGVVATWVPLGLWVDGHSFAGFVSLNESPLVHAVARVFSDSANVLPFAVVAAVLLGAALKTKGPRRVGAVALLLAGANASSQLLKPFALPVRDTSQWTGVPHLSLPSFPSGHATASMSLALAAVLVAPRAYRPIVSVLGVVYTVGVGLALPILGWHYPSDVAGGYLLAGAWSLVALAAERAAAQRWPEPGTIRGAARRAIAPPPREAVLLATALIGTTAIAVAAPRAGQIAAYADAHTAVVIVAGSLAACAAAVLGAIAAIVNARA
jgi:membrane-associated phospholipid phosphatase